MTISEANSPLAENLMMIIKEKGLKKSYVAQTSGFTPAELSDMLNGRRLIKACDIPKSAYALGMSSGDIYEYKKKAG